MSIKQMTAQEYLQTYGEDPFSARSKTAEATRAMSTGMTNGILNNIGGFATGVAQSGLRTAQNIGQAVLSPFSRATGFDVGGFPEETFEAQTGAQRAGQFVGDTAQFLAAAKATGGLSAGLGLTGKAAWGTGIAGAGLTGAAQRGPAGGAIAATTAALVPPALRLTTKAVGSMFRALGAGLSGTNARVIQAIVQNPQGATEAARTIKQEGLERGAQRVLEKNTNKILNGVMSMRKNARAEFGRALEQLDRVDINQETIRNALRGTLEGLGITFKAGKVSSANTEIVNPAIQKKFNAAISTLNNMKVETGKDMSRFIKKIDDFMFKVSAGTDSDRLVFNSMLNKMKQSALNALDQTTNKLRQAKSDYAADIQLVEEIQRIFGKIRFNNLTEFGRAAERMTSIFSGKGVRQATIEKFLRQIGQDPSQVFGEEAFRQTATGVTSATPPGLSVTEATRAVSGVVDPQTIAEIARKTGIAQQTLEPIIERLAPAARSAFITSLLQD